MKNFGIYIHWPYCLSKCPYCDFYSRPCTKWDAEAFLKAYLRDLRLSPKRTVSSIFFGGGTPSLMPLSLIERLLEEIQKTHTLSPDIEISMEANPDAIDKDKMTALKKLGINRLSLGVQALNADDLKLLGRRHSLKTALARIREMQDIFPNHSVDIIYGRPRQTLAAWENELATLRKLKTPHISLYQLTIEEGTPFAKRRLILPPEETLRDMFLITLDMMEETTPFYEVSNFAKKGFECRHNLTYWHKEDYLGLGPAAHGRLGNKALQNPADITRWLSGEQEIQILTKEELFEERLIMGLRLRDGIDNAHITPEAIHKAESLQWITCRGNKIIPTKEGFLMLNQLTLLLAQEFQP